MVWKVCKQQQKQDTVLRCGLLLVDEIVAFTLAFA